MTTHPAHTFVVQVGEFRGPLDLLLDLIERRKLSINEISLATVADDFITYVRSLSEFPVSATAHFILIASTLLLIKSKSLLPSLMLSEEEQGNIQDLERRLLLYKKARELSSTLRSLFGIDPLYEPCERPAIPVFSAHQSITLSALHTAVTGVLSNFPKKETLPKAVVDKVVSLEEMIDTLTTRIQSALRMTFKEFAKERGKRVEVIVSFLAMLELVKQGVISASQEKHFDDIIIETGSLDVPRYA